jgi:cell division protein FtsB
MHCGCRQVWFHLAKVRANAAVVGDTRRRKRRLPLAKNKSLPSSRFPAFAEAARERVLLWRRRAATIAVGALALGMGYGVVFGHNGLTAFAKKREEAKDLEQQTQVLKMENERLRGHVDRLQNDPSAIEHEARAQLHYTRTGEVIYTLPANRETTPGDADKSAAKR